MKTGRHIILTGLTTKIYAMPQTRKSATTQSKSAPKTSRQQQSSSGEMLEKFMHDSLKIYTGLRSTLPKQFRK
jgi:hypothetical protein